MVMALGWKKSQADKKQLENTYALVTPSLGEAVWTGCANDEDYELQGRECVLWMKQLTWAYSLENASR